MATGEDDNIPAASGSPDASLTQDDSFTATSHAGLTYPWGDAAPGTGETIRIAPGIRWARIPMPGSLGHINSWLLDDADEAGEGVARGVGVQRRDRPVVTRVHGLEHVERGRVADLADDDAVGAHTQGIDH